MIRGSLEALEVAGHSMELAIKQDVVPVINGLQKNFLDSFDIAHTLHAHGINIRSASLSYFADVSTEKLALANKRVT